MNNVNKSVLFGLLTAIFSTTIGWIVLTFAVFNAENKHRLARRTFSLRKGLFNANNSLWRLNTEYRYCDTTLMQIY